MAEVQSSLFTLRPTLDNPLRAPRTHPLVVAGIMRLTVTLDLGSERTISLANSETYVGHCAGCPDVCGITDRSPTYQPPNPRQLSLWPPAQQ